MADDDELLEYETEAEEEAEQGPVPVCVAEPVVTVPTVPQHLSTYTVVVETDDDGGVAELLPYDPLRVRARLWVHDAPVVLCHSRNQAQDNANQTVNTPRPNGAYIPASPAASTPVEITATARLWVAATVATPARIGVIVERRSA